MDLNMLGATLLGGVMALVGSYLTLHYQFKSQREEWRHERKVSVLVSPVIGHIDLLLEIMSATYWKAADLQMKGQRWDLTSTPEILDLDKLESFRKGQLAMEGRLNALTDPELLQNFKALDDTLFEFRGFITEGKVLSKAFNKHKEARGISASLYKSLAGLV